MGRLATKIAIVTGAANGIGRAIALRFAAEGAAVVGCDTNPDAARETLELVRAAGGIQGGGQMVDADGQLVEGLVEGVGAAGAHGVGD